MEVVHIDKYARFISKFYNFSTALSKIDANATQEKTKRENSTGISRILSSLALAFGHIFVFSFPSHAILSGLLPSDLLSSFLACHVT